uniref:Uncharacterized protein n=1 Tax=Kalanchoe fedtschenkoi TaxID=63787 RepID=A0A7N0V799_KALFE
MEESPHTSQTTLPRISPVQAVASCTKTVESIKLTSNASNPGFIAADCQQSRGVPTSYFSLRIAKPSVDSNYSEHMRRHKYFSPQPSSDHQLQSRTHNDKTGDNYDLELNLCNLDRDLMWSSQACSTINEFNLGDVR